LYTAQSAQVDVQTTKSVTQSAEQKAQQALDAVQAGGVSSGGGSGSVDISGKADKVSGATAGNIAALDASVLSETDN